MIDYYTKKQGDVLSIKVKFVSILYHLFLESTAWRNFSRVEHIKNERLSLASASSRLDKILYENDLRFECFYHHYSSNMRSHPLDECIISSDGRVERASASGSAHYGLIPSRIKAMTVKLVFTASLLDAQQ